MDARHVTELRAGGREVIGDLSEAAEHTRLPIGDWCEVAGQEQMQGSAEIPQHGIPGGRTKILEVEPGTQEPSAKDLQVDEIGHVYYLRSRLGPVRLRLARLLLPVIARSMVKDVPEAVRLFGREQVLARILDPEVVAAASAACEDALSLEYQPRSQGAAA